METTIPHTGEVALWRAVIQQALNDATLGMFAQSTGRRRKGNPSPARLCHQGQARTWLLDMSRDFQLVCDHALLDPMAVRAAAAKSIADFDRDYLHLVPATEWQGRAPAVTVSDAA